MPTTKGLYTLHWLHDHFFFPRTSTLFRMLLCCLAQFHMYGKLQTLLSRNNCSNFPHYMSLCCVSAVSSMHPVIRSLACSSARETTLWNLTGLTHGLREEEEALLPIQPEEMTVFVSTGPASYKLSTSQLGLASVVSSS